MLECVGGRARLARLPFIPGMVVVVVVVAPLKPCILYKREYQIDRQTIPLWGLGGGRCEANGCRHSSMTRPSCTSAPLG